MLGRSYHRGQALRRMLSVLLAIQRRRMLPASEAARVSSPVSWRSHFRPGCLHHFRVGARLSLGIALALAAGGVVCVFWLFFLAFLCVFNFSFYCFLRAIFLVPLLHSPPLCVLF